MGIIKNEYLFILPVDKFAVNFINIKGILVNRKLSLKLKKAVNIMKTTQKELMQIFRITRPEAKKIQLLIMHKYYTASLADYHLEQIDKILQCYGVEIIYGEQQFSYDDGIVLYYVNTGDMYNTTIYYNTYTQRFYIGDIGTFIEKYGDKYHIQ